MDIVEGFEGEAANKNIELDSGVFRFSVSYPWDGITEMMSVEKI